MPFAKKSTCCDVIIFKTNNNARLNHSYIKLMCTFVKFSLNVYLLSRGVQRVSLFSLKSMRSYNLSPGYPICSRLNRTCVEHSFTCFAAAVGNLWGANLHPVSMRIPSQANLLRYIAILFLCSETECIVYFGILYD